MCYGSVRWQSSFCRLPVDSSLREQHDVEESVLGRTPRLKLSRGHRNASVPGRMMKTAVERSFSSALSARDHMGVWRPRNGKSIGDVEEIEY